MLTVEALGLRMTHDTHDRGEDGREGCDPDAHDNPHDTAPNRCPGGQFAPGVNSAEKDCLASPYDPTCGRGSGESVMRVMRHARHTGGEDTRGKGETGGESVMHRR
jgi:hypothetical protein